MFGPGEAHRGSKADVQIVQIFKGADYLFSVEPRPIALQGADQHVGVYIAFERAITWLLKYGQKWTCRRQPTDGRESKRLLRPQRPVQ